MLYEVITTFELLRPLDHPAPVEGDLGDDQTLVLELASVIYASDTDGDIVNLTGGVTVTSYNFV